MTTPHPEHETEAQVLGEVIAFLDSDVKAIRSSSAAGANEVADVAISSVLAQLAAARGGALRTPYFGRLDVEYPDGLQTVYVGRHGFDTPHPHVVVSWQSPVGGLFYGDNSEVQRVLNRSVRLLLNRQLGIRDTTLHDILDRVDRRDGRYTHAATSSAQALLIARLDERGDTRMSDIVETIQSEQSAIIRAPADRSLIINGVAGSGKTAIGYHRLSYLLATENQLGLDLQPSRTLVLGPNAYFRSFASAMLPGLDLTGIRHTTYSDLALSALSGDHRPASARTRFRLQDRIFSGATDEPEVERVHLNRMYVKGSMKFAEVIKRLARSLRELKEPLHPIVLRTPRREATIQIDPIDVREEHARVVRRDAPIEIQRQQFLEGLLWRAERSYASSTSRPLSADLREEWREALSAAVGKFWPDASTRDAYYRALESRETIAQLTRDLLSTAAQKVLTTAPQTPSRAVDAEDLPALHLLHLLTAPSPQRGFFDHIVIDEGQDVSPIQYEALRRVSRTGTMTVLGDMSQAIYRNRGVEAWEDVADILEIPRDSVLTVTQSYRATAEIVEFANTVLKNTHSRPVLAKAFPRHGSRPRIIWSKKHRAMVAAIAEDIERIRIEGHTHIAVITKTQRQARALRHQLQQSGIDAFDPSRTPEPMQEAAVTVLQAALAKGVEYEAVIVSAATTENFSPAGPADGQLLYVAVSRALHHLSIHGYGTPSPFLDGLSSSIRD